MRSARIRAIALGAGAALALFAACEEVVVRPADVAQVRVEPSQAQVAVGSTVAFSAQAVNLDDRPVSGLTVAWSSADEAIATVTSDGVVTGRGRGQVQVRAQAGGQTGTAVVDVLMPAAVLLGRSVVGFSEPAGGPAPAPVNVEVSNAGDLPLTGLAAEVDFDGGPGGWLTIELSAATAPATLTLKPSLAGLTPGTYEATVRVTHESGPGDVAELDVTLEVRPGSPDPPDPPDPPDAPSVPTGFSASAVQNQARVELSWDPAADDDVAFRIRRRAPGETQAIVLAELAHDVGAHVDETVEPDGTYVYQLAACVEESCSSYTAEESATTFPLAPSALEATARSDSRIDLTWSDESETETGFRIERKSAGGAFSQIGNVGADNTAYSDTGLNPETAYTYRVRACNGGGCSAFTAEVEATTTSTPAPAAPSDLTATTVSADRIDLAWTDNSNSEESFRIGRSVNNGSFTHRATANADATSFTDTQVAADNVYTYRVEACGPGDLCSDHSNEATTVTPPVAPSGLSATAIGPDAAEVEWVDDVRTETSFELRRRPVGGSFTAVATLSAGATGFSDDGLESETSYEYQIRACNEEGCSSWGGSAGVTTWMLPPADLEAEAESSTEIELTWRSRSTTQTGFEVARDGSVVATAPAGAERYLATGLDPLTGYEFRVRAVNELGESAWSGPASATTLAPPPPAAPGGLTAEALSPGSIGLSWSDNSDDETRFEVQRRLSSGGGFSLVATLPAGTTTHEDSDGLAAETSYDYRVRACHDHGCSAYSGTATATTRMLEPADLAATAVSPTEIELTWRSRSSTETGFEIERDGSVVHTTAAGSESYTATGLDPLTTYSFRVRAVNGDGASAWAGPEGATTPAPPPPAAPGNLEANAVSHARIDLSWSDNSDDETHFELERRAQGESFSFIIDLGENATTHVDTQGLAAETSYEYRIRACHEYGCSDYAGAASATTHLPAPSSLEAGSVTDTSATLTWADNSRTETGFEIEQDGIVVHTTGPDAETHTVTGLSPETAYTFRVRAINDSGASAWSDPVDTETTATPPTELSVAATTHESVTLQWTSTATAVTGFHIEQNGERVPGSVPGSRRDHVVGGLQPSTDYRFRVRSVTANNASPWSHPVETRTAAAPASAPD